MNYDDLIYISEELGNRLSRTQVSVGDIVISQRGSLGQCAVVDNCYPKLNISANIIAIKNINGVSAEFIRNFILSEIGQSLLERNISGQVQQKITTQDIADLLIPTNCDENKLCKIIQDAYTSRKNKLKEADELLYDFEDFVTQKLSLKHNENRKICFAIKLHQLDGVIDVKRYYNNKSVHISKLSDICSIIDEKVNVSTYGDQIVDWIRIDDLPNFPMDIEKVRTVSANKINGSFYKVQPGDILLARLGPTILNQKIVMVKSTSRDTLASTEFLILRCKGGYIAEAVMAILKTQYYKNLMYSYSRGSTPSRYRLNREDALNLSFPNINEVQDEIAKEATTAHDRVISLRTEAEQEWQAAKIQFEKELLGEL